jgi:DNA-binding PadR family transcriptional regulator
MNDNNQPLTPPAFYVLLALSQRERHGYDIMKTVAGDSAGKLRMGPGTLYGLIKRLLAEGLIEESDVRPDPSFDNERRRYYRLTSGGRARLGTELRRFEQAVKRAHQLGVNFRCRGGLWTA